MRRFAVDLVVDDVAVDLAALVLEEVRVPVLPAGAETIPPGSLPVEEAVAGSRHPQVAGLHGALVVVTARPRASRRGRSHAAQRARRELAVEVVARHLPAHPAVERSARGVEARDHLAALVHAAQAGAHDLPGHAAAARVGHHRHRRESAHRHGASAEELAEGQRGGHGDQALAVEGADDAFRVVEAHERLASVDGDVEGVGVEVEGPVELGVAKGADLHGRTVPPAARAVDRRLLRVG